jgi:hypothetical protein
MAEETVVKHSGCGFCFRVTSNCAARRLLRTTQVADWKAVQGLGNGQGNGCPKAKSLGQGDVIKLMNVIGDFSDKCGLSANCCFKKFTDWVPQLYDQPGWRWLQVSITTRTIRPGIRMHSCITCFHTLTFSVIIPLYQDT